MLQNVTEWLKHNGFQEELHQWKGMSNLPELAELAELCRNFFWFLHVKKYW
jgi:hypothetical protein